MKNIIITGAANGVGKAIAKLLQNENLILVDSDKLNLEQTAKELNKTYFVCDLTIVNEIKLLKDFVMNNFKNVDALINCAGVWTKGELSQLSNSHFKKLNELEKIQNLINTNVFATIAMITEFSPIMMQQHKGQIININSQSGVETEEFCPIYNASKHGTYNYRKAIQRDLAKHNVKITDVCPGLIKTDFYIHAEDELPNEIMKLGLEPEDVANCVKYLLDLPHEITIPSIEIRNIKNY